MRFFSSFFDVKKGTACRGVSDKELITAIPEKIAIVPYLISLLETAK